MIKNKNNMEEKYYTPLFLINKMWDILQEENIQAEEWLENSAGAGAMIDFLKLKSDKNILAYDILNETGREDIKECNYLKEKIEYKKGRVAFINPPFTKGLKFCYKALDECDYCIALLSITSILNLDYDKYEAIGYIYYKKSVKFENVNVDICIMLLKKKDVL
jgi:hypothetical protein